MKDNNDQIYLKHCIICETKYNSSSSNWNRWRFIPENAHKFHLVPEISLNYDILCNHCYTTINTQLNLIDQRGVEMLKSKSMKTPNRGLDYVKYEDDIEPKVIEPQQSSSNVLVALSWNKNKPHERKNEV